MGELKRIIKDPITYKMKESVNKRLVVTIQNIGKIKYNLISCEEYRTFTYNRNY